MKIVDAAIRLADGRVIDLDPPRRHPSIILFCQSRRWGLSSSTQGFLLENGEFVDRQEAYKIAIKSGQLIRQTKTPGTLYTEDLW